MDTICLFGIPVFGLFEFKISDIWQQLVYRTKLRTTGLMALPLISRFHPHMQNKYYSSQNRNKKYAYNCNADPGIIENILLLFIIFQDHSFLFT